MDLLTAEEEREDQQTRQWRFDVGFWPSACSPLVHGCRSRAGWATCPWDIWSQHGAAAL